MMADARGRSRDAAGPSGGDSRRAIFRRPSMEEPLSPPGGLGSSRSVGGPQSGRSGRPAHAPFQARQAQAGQGHDSGNRSRGKDAVTVAIRFRPLSKKERLRGDVAVWDVDDDNTVGPLSRGNFKPKYKYDQVFRGGVGNAEVYQGVAEEVVRKAMSGINGTIFAYGVTSSGKTHTMMGDADEPGIVPQAVAQVFDMIENMPSKEFLLRLSMMEIYNEVLNDLLDPTRTNLKIRTNSTRGIHVDGLKEEVVLSVEHALSLIAIGEANRKVASTTFNEGSSRSHILCRFCIEVSDKLDQDSEDDAPEDVDDMIGDGPVPQPRAPRGPREDHARTMSYLNLIDLAGSESAKATDRVEIRSGAGFSFRKMLQKAKSSKARGKRMEGSYINKSLLTLGTVIHKMSESRAAHVPFRDSKLTRLLQPSLTGSGAKVAIVCTVTPASTQAEETHNTLKFASRAKKIQVKTSRNEIMDDKSLIRRYQLEIADLKRQLEVLTMQREATPMDATVSNINKDMEEQLYTLRERLEEELRARLKRDEDKAALEARINRLTRLILHSSAPQEGLSLGPFKPSHLRSRSFDATLNPQYRLLTSDFSRVGDNPSETCLSTGASQLDSRLFTRDSTSTFGCDSNYVLMDRGVEELIRRENRQLHERVNLMAEEMAANQRRLDEIKAMLRSSARSGQALNTGSSQTSDGELEMSVLQADREVLQDTLSGVRGENRRLLDEVVKLKVQLKRVKKERDYLYSEGMGQEQPEPLARRAGAPAAQVFGPSEEAQSGSPMASSGVDAALASTCSTTVCASSEVSPARWSGSYENTMEDDVQARLVALEHQVHTAMEELVRKDQQLASQREEQERIQMMGREVARQLKGLSQENEQIKAEHAHLELQNNRLQGYLLDGMSPEELNKLIYNLTTAAERVRLSVQLRKIQTATSPASGNDSNKESSDDAV
ncbi:unnamed protein product [Ostreobium quekettii]|uniref:Kinesin motor domain-containing protein n=1 Tax=Ostreobium quekettii TaxID=121088 RepID=A0A8S1IMW9_9CHLO|nr:unnamed protein product [Ostreobium quekettii]|eukprot:evm.model.scf_692.5 EVM.evm.TU.scf_692.5   scf_692:47147-55422(+)